MDESEHERSQPPANRTTDAIERYSVMCVLITCFSMVFALVLWRMVRSDLFCESAGTPDAMASCRLLAFYFLVKMVLYCLTMLSLVLFLGAIVLVVRYWCSQHHPPPQIV